MRGWSRCRCRVRRRGCGRGLLVARAVAARGLGLLYHDCGRGCGRGSECGRRRGCRRERRRVRRRGRETCKTRSPSLRGAATIERQIVPKCLQSAAAPQTRSYELR